MEFKARGTIRVETKWCYLAFLEGQFLYKIQDKWQKRRDEKKLENIKALPYFKGVTKNTHLRIIKAIRLQWVELN